MKISTLVSWLFMVALAGLVVFTSPRANRQNDIPRIGILQLAAHGSAEEGRLGFMHRLEELGVIDGVDVIVTWHNAQSDMSNLQLMADQLVADNKDVIVAISTPTAVAVANATQEIPILASTITCLHCSGLTLNYEEPESNISGVSALSPVAEQLEFMLEFAPHVRTIGIVSNPGEANSAAVVAAMLEAAEARGIAVEQVTVNNTNDVHQAVQSLVGRVDGIYVPADNTVAAAMPAVAQIALENDLPVVTASVGAAANGALGTIGVDWYSLGRKNADQALAIIFDGKDISQIPVETTFGTFLYINEEFLEMSNFELPDSIRARMQ